MFPNVGQTSSQHRAWPRNVLLLSFVPATIGCTAEPKWKIHIIKNIFLQKKFAGFSLVRTYISEKWILEDSDSIFCPASFTLYHTLHHPIGREKNMKLYERPKWAGFTFRYFRLRFHHSQGQPCRFSNAGHRWDVDTERKTESWGWVRKQRGGVGDIRKLPLMITETAWYSLRGSKVFWDVFYSAAVPKVSNAMPNQNLFLSSCGWTSVRQY